MVAKGKEINKSLLLPSQCAVLELPSEIYIWFGRNSNEIPRSEAKDFAMVNFYFILFYFILFYFIYLFNLKN